MSEAFICEGTRTPIGRFGGSLSSIRTDDLASLPLIALKENLAKADWDSLEEVFLAMQTKLAKITVTLQEWHFFWQTSHIQSQGLHLTDYAHQVWKQLPMHQE